MGGTRQLNSIHHGGRWTPLSQWVAIAAAVLGLATTDGQMATASLAVVAPIVRADVAPTVADASTSSSAVTPVDRADLRTELVNMMDSQAGQPFSFTVRVQNDGGAASSVRVSTVLPPAFSNVRVNAPGFACTRQFSASGPQTGTLVTCSRNTLQSGTSADMTVEANAPTVAGEYQLLATTGARDDAANADAADNQVVATIRVS
jgi:hypothetical protein